MSIDNVDNFVNQSKELAYRFMNAIESMEHHEGFSDFIKDKRTGFIILAALDACFAITLSSYKSKYVIHEVGDVFINQAKMTIKKMIDIHDD